MTHYIDQMALFPTSGDITYTSAGGGSISVGTSHAGSGVARGWSGKVKYFDNLRGIIYFENNEFRNNLDYSTGKYGDLNQEVRVLSNNNLARSHTNRHRKLLTPS